MATNSNTHPSSLQADNKAANGDALKNMETANGGHALKNIKPEDGVGRRYNGI